MTLRIEKLGPADRIDLIGRVVHVAVYPVGESTVAAQQTGTVVLISEDQDKILLTFEGGEIPFMFDKDQYETVVTVDAG